MRKYSLTTLALAAVLDFLGPQGAAAQDTSSTNDANNPLTPKVTFNLHNYYVPSLTDLDDRWANQFLLRGLVPHAAFDTLSFSASPCRLLRRRRSRMARQPESAT